MEVGKWKMAQTWRHFKRPASSKGLWKQFVDDSRERDQRAEVLTHDFDELTPREEQYYQKPPFSTNEIFLGSKGGTPQLVQPGPGRQGYAGPKGGVFSIDEYKGIAAEYDTVLQEAFDNRTLKNVPEFKEWATTNHGEQFNKKHHRKAVTKHSKLQFDTTRNKLLDTLMDEANDGFKFVELKTLQKQAGFTGKTAFPPGKKIYGKLDTATDKMKKGFDHLFMDSNKPAVEMFDSMRQLQKLTGIADAPARFLEGYVPYEDSKGLIKRLAIPLSKQRLSKVPELTLGELQFRIDKKLEKLFSAPRKVTPETQIFDIVKRHVNQGGTEIKWIKAPTKTDLGYPSYNEAKFKFKGKVYDMAELIKNAETDPNFKEFFKVQDDLKTLNSKIVTHPKKGTAIRFDKLMQEVYGYRTPYVMDHFGQVGKDPFSKLRILPTRINAAAGTLYQYDEKFITDRAKKGKYSVEGKKQALDKIGYNYQRNADDLFKGEFKLAEDVLKRGRVLRTPNQIVDAIRETKLSKTIPKAMRGTTGVTLGMGLGMADDLIKSPGAKKAIRGMGWLLGPLDVVLEGGMALPALARGNPQMARRSTTPGVFGSYGGTMLEDIKKYNRGAYRYTKAMKDVNEWNALEADIERAKKIISGEIGGYPGVAQRDLAEAKKKQALLEKNFSPTKDDDFQAFQDTMTQMAEDSREWSGDKNWLGQERGEQSTQESLEAAGVKPIDAHMMMQNADTTDEWRRKHQLEELDYELGGLDVETFLDPYGLKTQDPRYSDLPTDIASDYGNWEANQVRQKLEQLQNIDPGVAYAQGGIAGLLKK